MNWLRDLRHAIRALRHQRGFTVVSALVLAVGIASTTALFSIVNAIFFRPLPVRAPEELVYLYSAYSAQGRGGPMLRAAADAIEDRGGSLALFASHSLIQTFIEIDGNRELIAGEAVDDQYFPLLGVSASMGRALGPGDEGLAASDPAVVISHDFWRRRFGSRADIVGKRLMVGPADAARSFTIVGVAAQTFRGLADPWTPSEFWIPSPPEAANAARMPIARLQRGVTLAAFRTFLGTAATDIRTQLKTGALVLPFRVNADGLRFDALPFNDVTVPSDPFASIVPRGILIGLAAIVALVLILAATNIAGMLLARGVARAGEVATRRALGATPAQLVRQLLTESLLIATAGGLFGLILAGNLLSLFEWTTPTPFSRDVTFDWRVLLFSSAVCIGTGLLVGLAPAMQALRVNILDALANGIASTRQRRMQMRNWVVVPQITLSLVLLATAGVHVRALMKVELADRGYATTGTIIASVSRATPPLAPSSISRDEQIRQRAEAADRNNIATSQLIERIRTLPGVVAAGIVSSLPFRAYQGLQALDVGAVGTERVTAAPVVHAGDGYLEAIGIPVVSGRLFDERDTSGQRRVAVVSRSLAQELWPGQNAIGRFINVNAPGATPSSDQDSEVVGVVEDVLPVLESQRSRRSAVYLARGSGRSFMMDRGLSFNLVVRAASNQADVMREVKVLLDSDKALRVPVVRTVNQAVAEMLYPRRVAAAILASAALLGLALAAIGLYGVISYSMAQRRRELGIRATLGAGPADLQHLVFGEGLRVTAIGGIAGIVLAAIALNVSRKITPGLPFVDLITFTLVPAVLVAVTLVACYLPARRAARVNPVDVLRAQ